MIGLVDLDSLLYSAVYKIVSISQMKDAIEKYGKESAKQWLLEEVYNEGINRCENQLLHIQNHIDSIFFEDVNIYELFITTCENSFRKELCNDYKANRKRNEYVWLLREHYRHNSTFSSDTDEADDLIADRAKELGIGNYLLITIDKDLKQIGGYYWSYYRQKSKDSFGNHIVNELGFKESEYKQKEVLFITKEEAKDLFWIQMLMGDDTDNIKGIKGIGEVKSKKIIDSANNNFMAVAREYLKTDKKFDAFIENNIPLPNGVEVNRKKDFWKNYRLLKLGK